MSAFAGPFAIATCLLALAGFAKAMQPAATAGALAALGLPHRRWLVRGGGSAEALLACAALVTGDAKLAILVAVSYAGFALFVAAALYRGTPLSSCGCFGNIDTPPSAMHIALDLLAAGAAIGFVADGGAPIGDVLANQPMAGVPFALLVVIGVTAAGLTMTALPRTLAVARGRSS
jgi:hypothetical protein